MTNEQDIIHNSSLGQQTNYTHQYDPNLLFPIPRHFKRTELGITEPLPFYGFDTWNDYETSWLNAQGKPIVAITEFHIPCTSPNIIESKSLKLYLNALANTSFSSVSELQTVLQRDLSLAAGSEITVVIHPLDTLKTMTIAPPAGICIDSLNIAIDTYEAAPHYLTHENNERVTETLYTHLLKSNCSLTMLAKKYHAQVCCVMLCLCVINTNFMNNASNAFSSTSCNTVNQAHSHCVVAIRVVVVKISILIAAPTKILS